MAEPR